MNIYECILKFSEGNVSIIQVHNVFNQFPSVHIILQNKVVHQCNHKCLISKKEEGRSETEIQIKSIKK